MKQLTLFKQKEEKDIYSKDDKILFSFSGGLSSATLLLEFLEKNKEIGAEILVVFANTGDEHENTLKFINDIELNYGIKIYWIEAYVPKEKGKAPTPIIVDYDTASRDGKPLLDQSEKYGHCALTAPHCTRDLKVGIIHKFARSYFGNSDYWTFQGLRYDEQRRINWNTAKEKKWDYPLSRWGVTKPYVNSKWRKHKKEQGFTLDIEEHQGNCNLCFKKSDRKLVKLIREKPCLIIFRITLELVSCTDKHDQYRQNRTAMDILELAKSGDKIDDFSDFGLSCFCGS